jgi:GNAT superfamily N-acetyltransferase
MNVAIDFCRTIKVDTNSIVRSLRQISELKHAISPPKLLLDRPIADAQILVDPERVTLYPSNSGNTVSFIGTEQPITRADAAELVAVYRSHGVNRFFVYVSPSPWLIANVDALTAAGLTQFRGPDYHTLVRNVSVPITQLTPCEFRIERVTADTPLSSSLLEAGTILAASRPEFDVWVAVDGDTVAGHGMATTVGSVTYLGPAGTSEPYRNRGIQTALIRARLQEAKRRGSEIAVSETLSMLGSSLRNLQRAGFAIVYDKIVYQYNAN